MGVVRREGKWRLVKVEDGLYEVQERDQVVAEIVTDDYSSSGMFSGGFSDPLSQTIEVRDFGEAEDVFQEYVEGQRGQGLF